MRQQHFDLVPTAIGQQAGADVILACHAANIAEGRPTGPPFACRNDVVLDVEYSNDPEGVRIDDDDFLIDDEVAVATPGRMNFDNRVRHRHEANAAAWDHGSDVDIEVDRATRHL